MSTAANVTSAVADAALNALRTLILDDTGNFEVRIYSAAFAAHLVTFAVDGALLAAAAAGSTGKRAIIIDCDPAIESVGLAAGIAALWRIYSQDGVIRAAGDAGGVGSGHGAILSNTSIEEDQPVSLLAARIQFPFSVSE